MWAGVGGQTILLWACQLSSSVKAVAQQEGVLLSTLKNENKNKTTLLASLPGRVESVALQRVQRQHVFIKGF